MEATVSIVSKKISFTIEGALVIAVDRHQPQIASYRAFGIVRWRRAVGPVSAGVSP